MWEKPRRLKKRKEKSRHICSKLPEEGKKAAYKILENQSSPADELSNPVLTSDI